MDTETGVAVNTSLTVVNNLSVGGDFDCATVYSKDACDAKFQHRYAINASHRWVHLGPLYTAQVGRSATSDISTTNGFSASATQHKLATLQFVTSNGSQFISGVGGNFYGSCSIRGTTSFPVTRVIQISTTEYQFWIQMPQNASERGSFLQLLCVDRTLLCTLARISSLNPPECISHRAPSFRGLWTLWSRDNSSQVGLF